MTEAELLACEDPYAMLQYLDGKVSDDRLLLFSAASAEVSGRGRGRHCGYGTILRDIFGNPFRPVAFSPGWHTDTAVALARQMYESRDFGATPILADSLQEAGCDSEDVLNHCRDSNQVHVRGCWAVDLVLGKSQVL